ncbi:MAG: DNA-directed RNA polymerase subunit omega [Thermonemataceae bacterium]
MAKLTTTSSSLVTRDPEVIEGQTDNIYKSLVVISKRAKQIALETKEELHSKLNEFASAIDNLEEVFENREQIEISRYYERLPKPTTLATEEFLEDKVGWQKLEDDGMLM